MSDLKLNLGSYQYYGLSKLILEFENNNKVNSEPYFSEPLDPLHISNSLKKHIEDCRILLINDFDYNENDNKNELNKLVKIKNYEQMFRFYKNISWHLFDAINIIYFSIFPKLDDRNYANETDCANQVFELKQRGIISSYNCLIGFDT